jgi:hypothetical protein
VYSLICLLTDLLTHLLTRSLTQVPLMTYEWWAKTQTRHYPNVVIPNEMYHPGKPNGYSILEFLLSNTNRFPVFIAGSWYVSVSLYMFGTTTTSLNIETHTYTHTQVR